MVSKTKNLAIMFTDIKGFTARTSNDSREGIDHLLREHDRLLVPVFRHFGGIIIKTIGDAFLVTFESPTDSVLCGLTIQEVLRQYNAQVSEKDRIDVRVAINAGEVQLKDNDVLGEPVNLAARVEGITDAGEVYFTESVFLSMKRQEVPTAEVGEHVFKGIPYPVRVYRVLWDTNSEQARELSRQVEMTKKGPIIRVKRSFQGANHGRNILLAAAVVATFAIIAPPLRHYQSQREQAKHTRMEAMQAFQDFANSKIPESDGWQMVRDIVDKNPSDAEIPFQAGEILSRRFIPESVIWLYGESAARGGDPTKIRAGLEKLSENPSATAEDQAAIQKILTKLNQ